jgi:hypothetical protein
MLTQKMLLNLVMAVSLVGCLVMEHYGLIPVGTEDKVVFLIAGVAAGSGSLIPVAGSPVFSGGGNKNTIVEPAKPGARG